MSVLGVNDVLRADPLARVEGEGAMRVTVRDGAVADVALNIFEPPRFFEAFLRGRAWTEPPDITARICGICPVAYQMSACLAIEDACGVVVPPEIQALRRLLYCGEWIESHALHIYLLHAPDFLGYDGGLEMAKDHPDVVNRGLSIKKAGNELMEVVGGRSVHPVNVAVGGFHRFPTSMISVPCYPRCSAPGTTRWPPCPGSRGSTSRTSSSHRSTCRCGPTRDTRWTWARSSPAGVERSRCRRSRTSSPSSTSHARTRSTPGWTASRTWWARWRGTRSTTTGCRRWRPRPATAGGLGAVCRNPFRSIIVRAVELVYACDEAVRLIEAYDGAGPAAVVVEPRTGTGHGATEAPRGALYHRYELSAHGTILSAQIVPPTSQNLASMEQDLRLFAQDRLDLDPAELTRQCEQAVRNYDPCISCATHFLRVTVERG